MSGNISNKNVSIYIDHAAAENALQSLQRSADKLNASIQKGRESGKSMTSELTKLKGVNESIKAVQKQIDTGLRPSFAQQETLVSKLSNELKRMSEDAPGYAAKFKSLRTATAEMDRMKNKMTEVSNSSKGLFSSIKGISAGVLIGNVATSMVSAASSYIKGVANLRKEFEQSVAGLSAITGATGQDLNFLKNAAIELSTQGVNSAKDFVEAMKLIGSAKPELLSQKELLLEVTKATKLLSEASGLELPDAAKRLTDALNQYGAGALEAEKYVDALAAGAKYGAAEVNDITESLLQFGTQAANSNVNIYESTAAIELLAEKGIKGAEAGTKLRNVFLALNAVDGLDKKAIDSLAAAGVNTELLKDKSLSLQTRLDELSKVSNNAASLVAIFGKENFNAAQIVLQNIPRYAELAGQVRETGVASEQAAINTNTWAASTARLSNVLDAQFFGDNGFFVKFTNGISDAIEGLGDFFSAIGSGPTGFGLEVQQQQIRARMKGAAEADAKAIKGLIQAVSTQSVIETTKDGKVIKNADGTTRKRIIDLDAAQKYDAILKSMKWDEEQLADAIQKKDTYRQNSYNRSIYISKGALELLGKEKTAIENAAKAKADADAKVSKATSDANAASRKKTIDKALEDFKKLQADIEESIAKNGMTDLRKKLFDIDKNADKQRDDAVRLAKEGKLSKEALQTLLDKIGVAKTMAIKELITDKEAAIHLPINIPDDFTEADYEHMKDNMAKLLPKIQAEINRNDKAGLELDILNSTGTAKLEAKKKMLEYERDMELTNTELTENEKALITAKYRQQELALDDEARAEKAKIIEEYISYATAALDIIAKLNDAKNTAEKAQLDKELKQSDTRKKSIEQLAASKVITEKEAKRRIREIELEDDRKKQELEKKQFERNKKIQIAQTIMNAAAAAVQLWVKPGFPAAIPLAIVLAAQTAAQIAMISSQKPQFAKGGVAQGAKHSQGGINMIDTATGHKVGEMEGNEPYMILSDNTYRNNKPIVDALLHNSLHRNGAPIWQTRPYQPLNYAGVNSSYQKLRYAQGGVTQNGQAVAAPPVIVQAQNDVDLKPLLNAILFRLENPIPPEISLKKITTAQQQENRINQESALQ